MMTRSKRCSIFVGRNVHKNGGGLKDPKTFQCYDESEFKAEVTKSLLKNLMLKLLEKQSRTSIPTRDLLKRLTKSWGNSFFRPWK